MASVAEKTPTTTRATCGTYAGYQAHRNHNEITCQPCRDARAIYAVQQRKIHPEFDADYRARTTEKRKASKAKSYVENPNGQKAAIKRWNAANPEKVRAKSNRRRARNMGVKFAPYTESQVLALYDTDCHICHKPIDLHAPRRVGRPGWERGLHMEHVIALTNDGPDTLENVRPAHGLCNLQKHTN